MGKRKLIFSNITDDEKWETINNEVALYFGVFNLIKPGIQTDLEIAIKTTPLLHHALHESWAIHTRNLCEVFTNVSSTMDISLASLVDSMWYTEHKNLLDSLADVYNPAGVDGSPKNMLDKFLFHPTLNRRFRLNLRLPLRTLCPPIIAIIRALPDEKIPAKENHSSSEGIYRNQNMIDLINGFKDNLK